jgi:predicted CXXCH cytochrome family protein
MENIIINILFMFSSFSQLENIKYTAAEPKCLECHKKVIEQVVVHSPTDDCVNCHKGNGQPHPKTDTKGFKLVSEGAELCYTCHDPKNKKSTIHPPVESGECLTCHSPHGSPNKSLLKEKSISTLCSNCHDLGIVSLKFQHKPVNEGKCIDCHDPHESDLPKLLKDKLPTLCFTCHIKTKEQTTLKNQHRPFKSKCNSCHQPHASAEDNLLATNSKDLCLGCHSELQDSLSVVKFTHKALNQGKACVNCHSPHASNEDKLIKNDQKTLCLSCHNKTYKPLDKKVINIKQLLQTSKYIHAPVDEGCTACHNPHYSSNSSLLVAKFSQEQYSVAKKDSFALCFTCHDAGLFDIEKSTTATNFRNGDKNLHYLHLNFSKARNCTICHNVHGSKNRFLINENTEFGKWLMPITFTVLENGGTCSTGCHESKKYER